MLTLEETPNTKPFALFNLGFRPFFLLAGIYAVVSMMLWMALYIFRADLLPISLSPIIWHGHEMIFGYAIAVISGFLLTAVGNWTNIKMVSGRGLMLLTLLWVSARIFPFSGLDNAVMLSAISDLLFMAGLLLAISIPIIKAQQWEQLPIVGKVALMMASNILFYLGLLQVLPAISIQWGLYSGFYLVISLILLMGRRVIPFFIEKGVNENISLKNWKWLDISSLLLFLAFIIMEVFLNQPVFSAVLAGLLFILHSIRLWGWYAKGIWKKPLLWVLYVGYGFMVLGFALKAASLWLSLSPWIPLHAFAAGGIGMVTIGMMSRVSLGHTGRNVFSPPPLLSTVFILLTIAVIWRVVFPVLLPGLHVWWIGLSQFFWITAFSLFVFIYAPMLLKTRVDGRFG